MDQNEGTTMENGIWTVGPRAMLIVFGCGAMIMVTLLALCWRYPILSYCCCCLPVTIRRKMREFSKDRCCDCCQRFNFGVVYDDDMSDLIRRRMEERRRNLQIRNDIMEQQRLQLLQRRENEFEEKEDEKRESVVIGND